MVIDQRRLKALELETRQGRPLGDDFNDYYVFKHVVRAERWEGVCSIVCVAL